MFSFSNANWEMRTFFLNSFMHPKSKFQVQITHVRNYPHVGQALVFQPIHFEYASTIATLDPTQFDYCFMLYSIDFSYDPPDQLSTLFSVIVLLVPCRDQEGGYSTSGHVLFGPAYIPQLASIHLSPRIHWNNWPFAMSKV